MFTRDVSNKNVSSFTIVPAVTTKPVTYTNYKGLEVTVPANQYVYVDTAAGVALIGHDHIEIFEDEYSQLRN